MVTLEEFFKENKRVALGFSGGVDSSYLLYAGIKFGADIRPYFVKGDFQPDFELRDAEKIADQTGAGNSFTVLQLESPASGQALENTSDRCYYCKRENFRRIIQQAAKDGYHTVIDGTNASDDIQQRPGYRALQELKVLSPLRMAGLTKEKIRELSREAGLFTWNKPSYSCLATRIPAGTRITRELLHRIENSEKILFQLGFTEFRVRVFHDAAKIQLLPGEMAMALELRQEILAGLAPYFDEIYLDMKGR